MLSLKHYMTILLLLYLKKKRFYNHFSVDKTEAFGSSQPLNCPCNRRKKKPLELELKFLKQISEISKQKKTAFAQMLQILL